MRPRTDVDSKFKLRRYAAQITVQFRGVMTIQTANIMATLMRNCFAKTITPPSDTVSFSGTRSPGLPCPSSPLLQ